MTQPVHPGEKGFFAALFDFSLTSFVTLKFLKLIYAVVTILVCLGTLGAVIAFLSQGGVGVFIGIVIVPLVGLVYLIIARIYVEVVAVLFRIGENTSILAAQAAPGYGASVAGPMSGGGYPGSPGNLGAPGSPGNPPANPYGYGTPPPTQ